ncbi:hypothetical protein BU17DRAFT_92969 [Hysterangium stoloniferum]|nr:hypothetical protein BU17DRAFT_92969 [Hysterangium stoloniferum]
MSNDQTSSTHSDSLPLRRPSPQAQSLTTSGSIANINHEERSQLHSLSHSPSPKLTSILLPPSDSGASRPQSAEGRVTSLSIPKHSRHPPRNHRSTSGTLKRRAIANADVGEHRMESHADTKEGTLLNFGFEDPIVFQPEDPQVLDDVRRALKAKVLRESRSSDDEAPLPSSSEVATTPNTNLQIIPLSPPSLDSLSTPSRPVIAVSTRSLSPSNPRKITFPSYNPSASKSVESLSSQDHSVRSPIPILVTHPDGSGYLDWSGNISTQGTPGQDRSILGRTFSLTKRKPKLTGRILNFSGRNSVDYRGSSGNLHAAMLDSVRRTAKRESLSRAEITKDELGRRYGSLIPYKPTGEPDLNILDVTRLRPDNVAVQAPWLSWCRQVNVKKEANRWTITADIIDEYLLATGRPPTVPTLSSTRSRSPYKFSSPLSSPRSSFSPNPVGHNSSSRREQLNRSLSANPIIKGIVSSSNLLPMTSRSLSMTPSPFESRHSIDAVIGAESKVTNVTSSPRSSMEEERLQLLSLARKEKESSLRRKFRASLGIDRTTIAPDSGGPSTLSSTSMLAPPQSPNGTSSSHRLHLGVGSVFDKLRRSSDEAAGSNNRKSRSSVSDDHDSVREGLGTKSDNITDQKEAHLNAGFELKSLRPIAKDTWNTSESETGLLTAKVGRGFMKSDTDQGEDDMKETRESISGNEQKGVDAVAGPGWSSKRGVRRARMSAPQKQEREILQDMLRRLEEEEEHAKEVYRSRELLLIEANDHNRNIARMLKAVCSSIREYEKVQAEFAQAVGREHTSIPPDVLEAISSDPATTLRHGKGWRAVEHSHDLYHRQQDILTTHLITLARKPDQALPPSLGELIQVSQNLWQGLKVRSQQIEHQATMVKPALNRAVAHMSSVQKEYNNTQILVETDYPEQSQIIDLEMAILESQAPRGWLEFAAVWIPEHVLELIGGFIRFFGVSISEKFIRPILWYFFRNQYYWKIYSTEPPPNERAWYTRLAYWVVIVSILAWLATP